MLSEQYTATNNKNKIDMNKNSMKRNEKKQYLIILKKMNMKMENEEKKLRKIINYAVLIIIIQLQS